MESNFDFGSKQVREELGSLDFHIDDINVREKWWTIH